MRIDLPTIFERHPDASRDIAGHLYGQIHYKRLSSLLFSENATRQAQNVC